MTVYAAKEEWTRLYEQGVGDVSLGTVPAKRVGKDDNSKGYDGGPVFVIVEVEGRFFKKSGYVDSYDGYTWDGPTVEVHKTTKTVEVFE